MFQHHVKRGHQRDRDDQDPEVGAWQGNVAHRNWHAELHTHGVALGTPDQEGDVLQDDRHAEAADDHPHTRNRITAALAGQPPVEDTLDHHAHDPRDNHRQEQGDRIGDAHVRIEHQPEEGTEHEDLAMGEMHDVEARIDQRDAQGDKAIDEANRQTDNNEIH